MRMQAFADFVTTDGLHLFYSKYPTTLIAGVGRTDLIAGVGRLVQNMLYFSPIQIAIQFALFGETL
jgi:hypothetical protein